ncbi:MAG TPA: hypothetical protein VJ965_09010 [Anaerolineales bacterium]|nr:hypothetical protein [Anaerolineales bacterium]
MTTSNIGFLPGEAIHSAEPLGRYLPRLPVGAVSRWLAENVPENSWVVDPFGSSPHLALEAARAGYRVLVISSNPVTRFVLETKATPPQIEDMQAALAALGSARRGDERLENHIRHLYQTRCTQCEEIIDAQAFLWERSGNAPYARVYTCPHCQQSGEFPTTAEDVRKLNQIAPAGLYRSRALERVASTDDPNRFHAEEALDVYLPRAVYTLINLVNKLDGLNLEINQGKRLRALLLAAFDQANNLWRIQDEQFRPRQLTTPPHFIEKNIWLALEDAVRILADDTTPATPLTFWPDGPPESGGICLFEGPVKELSNQIDEAPMQAVISALPRPNQAYWTLCALWSGWLWGREALGNYSKVLKRRRYDWAWHTAALHSSLRRLYELLPPETPFFGLVTENEAGFDTAAIVAADLAGFILENTALRKHTGQTQLHWRTPPANPPDTTASEALPMKLVSTAMQQTLAKRGEPSPYLYLQAAGLKALSDHGLLTPDADESPQTRSALAANAYTDTRQLLRDTLAQPGVFLRYQGGKSSLEIGTWWLRDTGEADTPLADRVEMAIVNLLQETPSRSYSEIDQALCRQFSELQTPDSPLIQTVLNSYAERQPDGQWQLRENDHSHNRREDVAEIRQILLDTGQRFGFSVRPDRPKEGTPLIWEQAQNGKALHFYLIASAILDKIVRHSAHPPEQGIIVLPGSRSGLVLHKREQNPYLAYLLDGGWRLLKFRAVRSLQDNERLNPASLSSYFALDPLANDDAQIPLF